MRVFETLKEAASELERDLWKSSKVTSTRVQNLTGLSLEGREAFGYSYAVLGGFPQSPEGVVVFGQEQGFPLYEKEPNSMEHWLKRERRDRLNPNNCYTWSGPAEEVNPALLKVKEGEHWGYTYRERMHGALDMMRGTLKKNRDSRRAFWPIYREVDARRAHAPTRIPCSIGYQPMIRTINGKDTLLFFYLERSCDFHNFWLSDVWFAREIQNHVAKSLGDVEVGALIHMILSFHSFHSEGTEIY